MCDEKIAKRFFLKKMSRTIFGHFLFIFGHFWPIFGFISHLLENCSFNCLAFLHEAIAKQFSWKNALGDFWAIFTHFRPFFTIFFLHIWRIFVYFFHLHPIFCSNLAIVMAPNSKICVFLDPPTLEVGTIDLPLSVR